MLPPRYVEALAKVTWRHYKSYPIAKRTGGNRVISQPSKELKGVLRWLLYNLIDRLPVHEAAFAYRKGRSHGIRANAEMHKGSRFLLRMDFTEFFGSIAAFDIATYMNQAGPSRFTTWTSEDSSVFADLVTCNNVLAMGAPTSPSMSNAICFRLDQLLSELAKKHGAAYSRYCDDLFFSSNRPTALTELEQGVAPLLLGLDCPRRLTLNESKTRHSSKRGRRIVTGIVLTSSGAISVGRPRKRRVRALIHKWSSLDEKEREKVRGELAYISDVEPEFVNSLFVKYGSSRMHAVAQRP
jgi:RNA-directed DNA polymerase